MSLSVRRRAGVLVRSRSPRRPFRIPYRPMKSFQDNTINIWQMVLNTFKEEKEQRPWDREALHFYYWLIDNKEQVLQQIGQDFATRYPPVDIKEKEIRLDETCSRITAMPHLVLEEIKKNHRYAKAQMLAPFTKEFKKTLKKLNKAHAELKPSAVRQMNPRVFKMINYSELYMHPTNRIALRRIRKMRQYLTSTGALNDYYYHLYQPYIPLFSDRR